MRVPGIKTAKNFSRWAKAHLLGGALILGYHRVAQEARDDYGVCVSPHHFAEQMEVLNTYAHPIGLRELVQQLRNGSLQPRTVAVTFDDGYADNLYQARPVLEKHAIPATVFVSTGYAGQEFWWDELARLVACSQLELEGLCLELGRIGFVWDWVDSSRDIHRRKFHRALYDFMLNLDYEELFQAMRMIRSWSGVSSGSFTARAMTHEELLKIAEDGLIEIGAHTHNHLMLHRLSLRRQRQEITSSKQDLERLLGRRIAGFSYPNGRATHDAERIVREAGFAFACTSLHDVVRCSTNLYGLSRFWQRDVDGDRFLQGLRAWI